MALDDMPLQDIRAGSPLFSCTNLSLRSVVLKHLLEFEGASVDRASTSRGKASQTICHVVQKFFVYSNQLLAMHTESICEVLIAFFFFPPTKLFLLLPYSETNWLSLV